MVVKVVDALILMAIIKELLIPKPPKVYVFTEYFPSMIQKFFSFLT
jgi:hypothetical protein